MWLYDFSMTEEWWFGAKVEMVWPRFASNGSLEALTRLGVLDLLLFFVWKTNLGSFS
jgi:hypothetical protein